MPKCLLLPVLFHMKLIMSVSVLAGLSSGMSLVYLDSQGEGWHATYSEDR